MMYRPVCKTELIYTIRMPTRNRYYRNRGCRHKRPPGTLNKVGLQIDQDTLMRNSKHRKTRHFQFMADSCVKNCCGDCKFLNSQVNGSHVASCKSALHGYMRLNVISNKSYISKSCLD